MKRDELNTHIARYFLRAARGQGLIAKLGDPIKDMLDGTVYLFAIKGLTGYTLPLYSVIVIVLLKKALEPLIAYCDERWGFWKAENWYQSYMLNPYNREVLDRLKSIEEKIK